MPLPPFTAYALILRSFSRRRGKEICYELAQLINDQLFWQLGFLSMISINSLTLQKASLKNKIIFLVLLTVIKANRMLCNAGVEGGLG